jgi:hypothetical protein
VKETPPDPQSRCALRARRAVGAFTAFFTLAAIVPGTPLGARVAAPVAAFLAVAFFTLPLAVTEVLGRRCPATVVRLLVVGGSLCLIAAAAATGLTAGELL